MIGYEIKKVFSKRSSKVALLLLMVTFMITCWFAMGIDYVDESGETITGPMAVKRLHAEKGKWNGSLDTELLAKVIRENNRIEAMPEAASSNVTESNIVYSWKQGFSEIRNLLNVSFAEEFRIYDYYRADSLKETDAERFYENRTRLLKEWLMGEAKDQYNQEEKDFLIEKYEEIKIPFYYEDAVGWTQLMEYSPTIIMIIMLILGYLVAGIFSGEFQSQADAIFFSSYYGRNRAIRAKLVAGFVITSIIYWVFFLLYSSLLLIYLGAGGAGSQIQTFWGNWKSFYNITNLQAYLLIAIGGFIGCVFMSTLTMLISAKTKSNVVAALTPFILIFLPSFLQGINLPQISKIIGLFPDQLLQIGTVLSYFNLYDIFGNIVGAVPVLLTLYLMLSLGIQPLIYEVYRRK